ncbi:MAG: hypothetical protein ABIJ56_05900 [Pseudomonadota bacterium]
MAIAPDMKNICDGIASSYETRMKDLDILTRNVHTSLKGFEDDRKRSEDDRQKAAKEQAEALADYMADLRSSTKNMIGGFRKRLKEIKKENKQMAGDMRADLDQSEAGRLKDYKSMMGGIRKDIDEINAHVKKRLKEADNMLKDFSGSHGAMSKKLRSELARFARNNTAGVSSMLGSYRSDMDESAAAWSAMASGIARKKGMKPAEAKVEARPRAAKKAAAAKKPRKKAKRKPKKSGRK